MQTFVIDEEMGEKIDTWLKEHNKTCRFASRLSQGAAGGRLTYSFTDTSLGRVTKVSCACGGEFNPTDYDGW